MAPSCPRADSSSWPRTAPPLPAPMARLPVAAEFPGRLDLDGETLSLIKPGATPTRGRGRGPRALRERRPVAGRRRRPRQVAPAHRSRPGQRRVSNWSDGTAGAFSPSPGRIGSSRLSLFFDSSGGDVYLDDLCWCRAPWRARAQLHRQRRLRVRLEPALVLRRLATNSHHQWLGPFRVRSLHLISTRRRRHRPRSTRTCSPVADQHDLHARASGICPAAQRHQLHLLRAGQRSKPSRQLAPGRRHPRRDQSCRQSLPPYPPLWLNEAQPQNIDGPTNAAGEREPWIELYNAGTNPLSLDGYSLADSYTNLAQWSFPSNAVIQPGQFLVVWADGQTKQTTAPNSTPASASRPATAPWSCRARSDGAQPILDYLNYRRVPANSSYGACRTASRSTARRCFTPRPAPRNNGRSAPLVVFINEWMAENTSSFADPADGDFDDWFELYNPGPAQWTSAAFSSPTT